MQRGTNQTEEAKQKIREARINREVQPHTVPHTQEAKEKIRRAFKGRHWVIGEDGHRHWID